MSVGRRDPRDRPTDARAVIRPPSVGPLARFSALVLALVVVAGPAVAQAPAALRGIWKLEPDRTDRPNAARPGETADARRGRSAAEPLAAEGYGGFPDTEADPTAVMALMRPPLQITIGGNDSVITMVPERANRLRTRPGGPEVTDTLLDGTVRVMKSRWKKDALVVERRFPDVARIKETFRIDPAAGTLLVDAEVSPERFSRKIVLRRVYSRVTETPKTP